MPMVFGVTSTGLMVPILVDTVGKLQVSVLTALPAGTSRIGSVGVEGWVSGAWQKNPLSFGYSGVVGENLVNLALAAGANNVDGTVVPAGEFWVITNIAMRYDGTVAGVELQAVILNPGLSKTLYQQKPPVTGIWYDRQGFWVIAPGSNMRLSVQGATLNDDGYLRYSGYRVDTDQ